MNKQLAGLIIGAGLIGIPYFTNDTEANTVPYAISPRIEELLKYTRNDVLFTIDDGPSRYTVPISQQLDSLGFKGIFFVVGSGITEKTRKNLVKVIKMGNEIGNHSYSHLNFAKLDIQSAKEEIFKTDSLITSLYREAHVEQKKKYLRYPFGKYPPASYKGDFDRFLDSLGYTDSPMFRRMDVDLRDRRREPSDQKIEKIKKNDTILLHEKPRTVQTIKKIVQNIDRKKEI